MEASAIDFQTHKIFLLNFLFLVHEPKIQQMQIFQHCINIAGRSKHAEIVLGKAESYFIVNLLRILRLFLLSVVRGASFACRPMFSSIYARLR